MSRVRESGRGGEKVRKEKMKPATSHKGTNKNKRQRGDAHVAQGSPAAPAKQHARKEKRSSSTHRNENPDKMPRFSSAGDGWLELDTSSPDAASSGYDPSSGSVGAPCEPIGSRGEQAEKRELNENMGEDEIPEKSRLISSVCVGYGASTKTEKLPAKGGMKPT